MAEQGVVITGLRLSNPIMLASGILGETGHSLARVAKAGAGALVTKSIGLEPRKGHPNPTVIELETGLLNAIGLANPGIDAYGEELEAARKGGVPIIASIFGKNPDEFLELATKMMDYGADGIELNLSCPHASGYGSQLGQDPVTAAGVVREAKKVGIPVWAKLTPNVTDLASIALEVAKAGVDALVLINTLKGMAIDVDSGRPILGNGMGGLSGPAIKPVGVRCVYECYSRLRDAGMETPIIGVGGIVHGADALEYAYAGASAVQIGSAIHYRGLEAFGLISTEMEQILAANDRGSFREVVGLAHK